MFEDLVYQFLESPLWPALFHYGTWFFVAYFFIGNLVFFGLLLVSFFVVRRAMVAHPMIKTIWTRTSQLGPPFR